MRAEVVMQPPSGPAITLAPGDIVGRAMGAALHIADPRVSEAHAMISLRGGRLFLLALRRKFRVGEATLAELELRAGTSIELASGVPLKVLRVNLPTSIAAIAVGGRVVPLSSVTSIWLGPPPRLGTKFDSTADAHVWSAGPEAWQLQTLGCAPGLLALDQPVVIGAAPNALELKLVNVDVRAIAFDATQGNEPLRVVSRFDNFEIFAGGRSVAIFGGVSARVLAELVSIGGPVSWRVVADVIWPDAATEVDQRRRWDVTLARIRAKLRASGVRSSIVHSDGNGLIQLVLDETDVIEDLA